MKKYIGILLVGFSSVLWSQKHPVDYVNPFIGTSNYGATHPGAMAPRGMVSVSPFNVAGNLNLLEKDSQWLSNPYVHENTFLTGFTHVNLSGVGCPDLGVIITMPTTGPIETNHLVYGSTYSGEQAKPGYYAVDLNKYSIKAEATASTRAGVSRYHFPAGTSNILLNLGLGLTNELGSMLRFVSSTEIEGMRTVGSFCYNSPEQAYPVYFVMRFSEPPHEFGAWKTPYTNNGVESQWMGYNGNTRLMKGYTKTVVGDSIGAYVSYQFKKPTVVEVKVGVSYVSIENARENLNREVGSLSFNQVYNTTRKTWNDKLSVVEVSGGKEEDFTVFYSALYHTQIHPNILNDINGEYPEIATGKIGKTTGTRYTTFSLWDTYRNYHQLMTLLYPREQLDMVRSMLAMYDENGWLPKWELNSTETFTMVGDPAAVVIADTYLRGLTDFDVQKAYEAMVKSATQLENNPLRPGLREYLEKGYLSVDGGVAGPVSTTQEYNMADYAIAQLAKVLGKKGDFKRFYTQSLSYKNLFDPKWKLLRPKHRDGSWFSPFDPYKGANFEKNVGYIEGNAWQYALMIPHDVNGLMQLMGGRSGFIKNLDYIFENNQFDMANEPDIAYPYLYNYVKGKEWKTQDRVDQLLANYFTNKPAGLPGNDDTGTMSAWAIYSMMGIYPIIPADPVYTITTPTFSKIKIHLDTTFYPSGELIIEASNSARDRFIQSLEIDGKLHKGYFLSHEALVRSKLLKFTLKEQQ